MGDDGRQLVLQGAELERVIPSPGAGMVRLGGDQVAAGEQLVPLDGGVVVDSPLVFFEALGEVKGQPVKIRRAGRGVFDRDAVPALALHQGPVTLVVHDGYQDTVVRMHDGRLVGW